MNRKFSFLLPLLSLPVLFSCHKDEEPEYATRAVLVYMAANNNLSSYALSDFEEIKGGYLPEWFDSGEGDVLLVYLHQSGLNPRLLRLYSLNGAPCVDTLIRYPSQNSCVDTTLRKVLKDAFGVYDASERGLIVSSHATGWLPDGYYNDPVEYAPAACLSSPAEHAPISRMEDGLIHYQLPEDPYAWMVKGIGYDDNGDNEMEIYDFEKAIDYKLDYLLFDCCLMGGVEMAYQLRNKVDYTIASQTEILADGFPYKDLMAIAYRRGSDVEARCSDMAELYYDYYNSQTEKIKRSATISVIKSSEMEPLASAVGNLMKAGGLVNTDTLQYDNSSVLNSVQRYFRGERHWFYDLDDYVCHVCPSGALYDAFAAALERAVVYKASTPSFMKDNGYSGGFDITHFSGLSTYIDRPENSYLENHYRKLDWGSACGF